MDQRVWKVLGSVAVLALTLWALGGCGGDDGDSSSDGTGSTSDESTPASSAGAGSGAASWVEVGGERYEFTTVVDCTRGDAFWGPDFRRLSFDTDGDFPGIAVGYAPEKADDEGVEDPNGVDVYPSVDPWWYSSDAAADADLDLELTPDGIRGSATVGVSGSGGPDGELLATFELSCGDFGDDPAGEDGDGDGSESDGGSDGSDAGAEDSGTVTVGGETFELSGPSRSDVIAGEVDGDAGGGDFDFEICETVNPAFEGEYNVAGTLGDGTAFRLSGNVDEEPGAGDGLYLGETFDEEQADELEVSLDGRTLSGSATTSRGDIEFTFAC